MISPHTFQINSFIFIKKKGGRVANNHKVTMEHLTACQGKAVVPALCPINSLGDAVGFQVSVPIGSVSTRAQDKEGNAEGLSWQRCRSD